MSVKGTAVIGDHEIYKQLVVSILRPFVSNYNPRGVQTPWFKRRVICLPGTPGKYLPLLGLCLFSFPAMGKRVIFALLCIGKITVHGYVGKEGRNTIK